MKKFFTFLFASFSIITTTAQENFDTAIQPGTTVSTYKVNSLFIEHVTSSTTDNESQGAFKKEITIMPNATTKDIKIVFKTDKAADATIVVLDETGKKVLHQASWVSVGNNNINIDNFHILNEGTYTIQLISNNETHTSIFMIWK